MVRVDNTDSETVHTLATNDTIYEQATTVHHWQLKDLISCDNESNLYCVHEQSTVRYQISEQKSSIVQQLSFTPYCMAVGHGYIAAGGVGSWLDVKSLKENVEVFVGTIGGTVNNSLHFTESPLGLLLFVCNNDWTIKILNLPHMDPLDTLEFPDPINYSASTQEAEHVIAVGDNLVTYLYQSTPSGYSEIAQLEGYFDVGLCCAWDPQGVRFATASQDGLACLWDRRSHKLIAKFHTEEGPCKNVKFCSSSMDILAFTEDSRVCHLVDTRKLQVSQSLNLEAPNEHDIAGLCFATNAQKLYVGTTTCGIHSYNINTVGRRRFSDSSFL